MKQPIIVIKNEQRGFITVFDVRDIACIDGYNVVIKTYSGESIELEMDEQEIDYIVKCWKQFYESEV